MSRFIKLSNTILNTQHIIKIKIYKNCYDIHFNNNKLTGFGSIFLSSISSKNEVFEISKDNNPLDYKIITDWINNET